ncbi:polyprenyl synthetase family protein [Picrophilus oshimae]|uniref:Geranylgeranyl pyrophosphate synthase n=1 Tax=Picrophilus torridus (strain ATCC 700027 / DSM 9790 / JCM 10055 / NBRC 100828 / KAW 2/3) TaxID=1122961 RepID=Q6L0R9_PICTO|nr:polyprenyl synthetase family protein [Picrophilus oshimae]AAT43433.1 geranylgeranyl pyrophosphate synthase [Picrophilus oshimae DSM 9789]
MKEYSIHLSSLKDKIEKELKNFFEKKLDACDDENIRYVIKELMEFTMNGGKRLRPIMMITGYSLFNDIDDNIIKASISIELAQSYLLIHDDIMDQSDMRRGRPSFHRSVETRLNDPRNSMNIAIVAGDLIDSFSHEALLTSGFDIKNLISADYEFSKVIEDTGKGQLIDIFSSLDDEFSESRLMKLHYMKTARYTIEGPLVMGAMLAGNKKDIDYLRIYGKNIGIAFQIKDDILGLFGDEKQTGKSIKSDVNEGKKTLLMIKAYERSNNMIRDYIKTCLSSGDISDIDFKKLKDIVVSTGSYDYSLKIMEDLISKGKSALKMVSGNEESKAMLEYLSDYILNRSN